MKNLVKALLLAALCLLGAESVSAQVGTLVTGTFKPPTGQTPAAAGITSITIGGTAMCGELTFVPYDSAGRRVTRIVYDGVDYFPIPVKVFVRCSDGVLYSYDPVGNAVSAGVRLIPNSNSTPAGTVYRLDGFLYEALASDGAVLLPQTRWQNDQRVVPDTATASWNALAIAGIQQVTVGAILGVQDEGTPLTSARYLNCVGAGVSCSYDAANDRINVTVSAGGGAGLSSVAEVDGSPSISGVTSMTVDSGDGIVLTNPSAGVARLDLSAVPDSVLATISTAGKVSGAALTLLANIPSGAGIIPTANLPASTSYLGSSIDLTSEVTGDLPLGSLAGGTGVIEDTGTGTPGYTTSPTSITNLDIQSHFACGNSAGINDTTLIRATTTMTVMVNCENVITDAGGSYRWNGSGPVNTGVRGANIYLQLDPASHANGDLSDIVSVEGYVSTKASNAQNIWDIIGVSGYCEHNGTGLVDACWGGFFGAYNNGGGTVKNGYGVQAYVQNARDEAAGVLAQCFDTSATATGATFGCIGLWAQASNTGVTTTGTDRTFGSKIEATRTGATGGTIETYGAHISLTVDNAGAGTHTATALHIAAFTGTPDTGYAIRSLATQGSDFEGNIVAPIFDADTGFRIAGGATSGNVLRGNGINFVSAQLALADLAAFTSAQLAGLLSDEYGTDGVIPRVNFTGAVVNDVLCVTDTTGGSENLGICSLSTVFPDNTFRIEDNSDGTKEVAFELSGVTSGQTRTLTVPDASGTIAVSATSPVALSAAGAISITANGINATHIDETVAYAFSSTSNTFAGTVFSSGANPGDAAAGFNLSNAECLNFERNPAGTDATLCFTTGNLYQFTWGSTDSLTIEDAAGAVIFKMVSDSSGTDRLIFQLSSTQNDIDVFRFGSGLSGTGQCLRMGSAQGDQFVARANTGVAIGAKNDLIACSAVTDDLYVIDSTATTGVTTVVFAAGAGQSTTPVLYVGGSRPIEFEGATADAFETVIAVTDPTADRTITLPDASGEVSLLGQTISLTAEITGTLPVANGGTNLTAAADDEVMLGNGTTWQSKAVPNCPDTGGNHLNYTASTNSFSCGTSGSGAATDFLGLSDTPSSYSGQAGKLVAVNGTETALEFVSGGGGGDNISVAGSSATDANFIEGTGIDLSLNTGASPDEITIAFDSTEIGTTTWGSGSGITWTFDASGGTDCTWTLGSASSTWNNCTHSFAAATALLVPTSGGFAPTADGSFGFDSTVDKYVGGMHGVTASFPGVICASVPAESLTNSTASLQDFSSVCTIPANLIVSAKILRITLGYYMTTGTSSVTWTRHLKLGSTVVYTSNATNAADGNTDKAFVYTLYVVGTAAAGASANVMTFLEAGGEGMSVAQFNNTTQPIALATNGTLNVVPGITFSGTGSTETLKLQFAKVEVLN